MALYNFSLNLTITHSRDFYLIIINHNLALPRIYKFTATPKDKCFTRMWSYVFIITLFVNVITMNVT